MAAWDVVGPLVVLLAAGGVGWVVWRLTPNRRRNAELAAKATLAEAESRKWWALSTVASPEQLEVNRRYQRGRGTRMEWDDLSDDELRARIANRFPHLPGEVVTNLVLHRDTTGSIISALFDGEL